MNKLLNWRWHVKTLLLGGNFLVFPSVILLAIEIHNHSLSLVLNSLSVELTEILMRIIATIGNLYVVGLLVRFATIMCGEARNGEG